MVNVYMNPENLEKKIAELEEYAKCAIGAQATVHCMYLKDPLRPEGTLGSLESAVFEAATEIKSHAESLRRCKTTMVNLNSNGVASHDSEGGISIEVPDDSAGLETTDKFQKWALGATDAHDLKSNANLDDKLPSGRSYEEVVKSIKDNKDDPTYSDSVISSIGPENLTSIPFTIDKCIKSATRGRSGEPNATEQQRTSIAELFGEVLASASRGWSKEKSESVSNAIVESVGEAGKYGKISVLNAMIGGHDNDKNHINDLEFGKDFLLSLGEKLEKLPWSEIKYYQTMADNEHPANDDNAQKYAQKVIGEYRLSGQSLDPLTGALDAMGNNPDVALKFFAPCNQDATEYKGFPVSDLSRFRRISDRDWQPDGFASYTAALAAASSKRGEGSSDNERALADDLTGHAIHFLRSGPTAIKTPVGEQKLYDRPDVKARVGMLLANCGPELVSVWGCKGSATNMWTGKTLPEVQVGKIDPNDPEKKKIIPGDFDILAYRVADEQNAMATIGAGIGAYSKSDSQLAISTHEGDRDAQIDGIKKAYGDGGVAIGYLSGLSEKKVEAERGKQKEGDSGVNKAVDLFFAAGTAGLTSVSGPIGTTMGTTTAKVATPAVTSILKPVVAGAFTSKDGHEIVYPNFKTPGEMIRVGAVQDAANAGLLDSGLYDDKVGFRSDWKIKDENGKIVGSDGERYRIDFSRSKEPTDVIDWIERSQRNGPHDPNMVRIQNEDGAYADGHLYGANAGQSIIDKKED